MATFDKERPQKPRHEAVSTLHWHKNDILTFFKFLQKKVSLLDKKASANFFYNFWGCNLKNHGAKPLSAEKIFSHAEMVFCYHNCSNVLWEKIVLV